VKRSGWRLQCRDCPDQLWRAQPDETLRARFRRFYYDEIGLYWPAERQLVDNGYAGILFPFTEMSAPDMEIRLQWDLAALMGYVSTWSAVKRALDAGQDALLVRFYDDMHELWGDPAQKRTFSWPINIRAGICDRQYMRSESNPQAGRQIFPGDIVVTERRQSSLGD
jgi:hypothetical protein